MTWESATSAVAWELAATAVAIELDIWSLTERRVLLELERGMGCVGSEQRRLAPESPPAGGDVARPRSPQGPGAVSFGQLDMFAAPASPAAAQAPAINPFEGPCVVCGAPGRRRLTFPAAFAAVMPPVEPTCVQHELVADWAIPLSADEASRVIRGEFVRTPTYRYRAVHGSKAAKQKVTDG